MLVRILAPLDMMILGVLTFMTLDEGDWYVFFIWRSGVDSFLKDDILPAKLQKDGEMGKSFK